jgi:hypothetical protein
MSARSQLNKHIYSFLILLVFGVSQCFAQGAYKGIQDDKTTATKHGLYEIQLEAKKFVESYNRKHHTAYEAMDPDLHVVVPKCVAPLKVKWIKDTKYQNGQTTILTKSVAVICTKTINNSSGKNWSVDVPIAGPKVKS